MNLRTKKALMALLRGAIVLGGWTVFGLARGGHLAITPLFLAFVVLFVAIAGYTWWWYGDSEKAVALRAKADAKKAEHTGRSLAAGQPRVVVSDDSESPVPVVAEPVEIQLPRYLRSLLPHMALKGWVMPLVFAVLAFAFWAYSTSQLDLIPKRHAFESYCFAAVAVFFVLARMWVGWRVRRPQTGT
ncbi:hypothetical protein [Streptomyces sp. NBC_01615]|uniref:hypothetical protein n=1 Tax=Streptomyces sp. NBC_01615 TaxID=2975898 RepID=UPI0038636C95